MDKIGMGGGDKKDEQQKHDQRHDLGLGQGLDDKQKAEDLRRGHGHGGEHKEGMVETIKEKIQGDQAQKHQMGGQHHGQGGEHKESMVDKVKEKIPGVPGSHEHGGEEKKKKKDRKHGEGHGHGDSSSDSD